MTAAKNQHTEITYIFVMVWRSVNPPKPGLHTSVDDAISAEMLEFKPPDSLHTSADVCGKRGRNGGKDGGI
jgi:hypothetical protein